MNRATKVLVAMSGGVDSSVAAALLVRAGFDVVGCFMRLGSPGETLDRPTPAGEACESPTIQHRGCCSILDAADARAVAAHLRIPLYVCNFKKDFARVIGYFVDEYAAGRTPNPCVRCNDWLKFGKLREYARELGASLVASGHYAQARPDSRGASALWRGHDPAKDQSYVLFGVPRDALAHLRFPVGHLPKPEVRAISRELGLPVSDKPDSQEICFVPDDDYAGLVERERPSLARSGEVVTTDGRVLASHAGQHRYTVGQRRGLPLALGHPLYVVSRDAASNRVVVGDKRDLRRDACIAGEANWLVDPPPPDRAIVVLAKVRSNSPAVPARVRVLPDAAAPGPSGRTGRFEIRFDQPQEAVAPGQAIVLYEGEGADAGRVLGGGWVDSASPPA